MWKLIKKKLEVNYQKTAKLIAGSILILREGYEEVQVDKQGIVQWAHVFEDREEMKCRQADLDAA
jgi:hypothetical protein